MDFVYLSAFPSVLVFIWFKTDAFYFYFKPFLEFLFRFKIISLDKFSYLNLFFEWDTYKLHKKNSNWIKNYSQFLILKKHTRNIDGFWIHLVTCWTCLLIFLSVIIGFLFSFKKTAIIIIGAFFWYYIFLKIYEQIKRENEKK